MKRKVRAELTKGKKMRDLVGPMPSQRTEEEKRSGLPYVEVDGRFAAPYLSYSDLGRDMNGKPLVAERHSWLDREGYLEEGAREFFLLCWSMLDAEKAAYDEEEHDLREQERRRGGR